MNDCSIRIRSVLDKGRYEAPNPPMKIISVREMIFLSDVSFFLARQCQFFLIINTACSVIELIMTQ